MSPDELEAILAVVDSGSFRSAAGKLHKSQSSISYSIGKLEKKIGLKIFDRANNQVALTDAGRIIYNKALNIEKINKEINDFSNFIQQGIETKVSLAITAVTPTPLLTKVLNQFNNKFPQTQVELKFTTHEEPVDYLLRGDADITITSSKVHYHELQRTKWHTVQFMAVTSPHHPSSLDGIREEDLNSMTHLVVGGRETLAKKTPARIVQNSNVWHLTDFLIKKELLLNGLGWGSMPKMLIDRELEEEMLVPVKCKKVVHKELDLVAKQETEMGPATKYLWSLFIKTSAAMKAIVPSKFNYQMTPGHIS